MATLFVPDGTVTVTPRYKPGDPRPSGYIERADWAQVQIKAGIKEDKCGTCGKHWFSHEMSGKTVPHKFRKTKHGAEIVIRLPICQACSNAKKGRNDV